MKFLLILSTILIFGCCDQTTAQTQTTTDGPAAELEQEYVSIIITYAAVDGSKMAYKFTEYPDVSFWAYYPLGSVGDTTIAPFFDISRYDLEKAKKYYELKRLAKPKDPFSNSF